jgi:hypothetical protein
MCRLCARLRATRGPSGKQHVLNPRQSPVPWIHPKNPPLSCGHVCRVSCFDGSMARKIGQIIRRGPQLWMVRIYVSRDPETWKRKYIGKLIHGGLARRTGPPHTSTACSLGETANATGPRLRAKSIREVLAIFRCLCIDILVLSQDALMEASISIKPECSSVSVRCFTDI